MRKDGLMKIINNPKNSNVKSVTNSKSNMHKRIIPIIAILVILAIVVVSVMYIRAPYKTSTTTAPPVNSTPVLTLSEANMINASANISVSMLLQFASFMYSSAIEPMPFLSSYLMPITNTPQDVNVTYNISFQANGTFDSLVPRNKSFVLEYSSKYGNSSASIKHNSSMDWIYDINNKYYMCTYFIDIGNACLPFNLTSNLTSQAIKINTHVKSTEVSYDGYKCGMVSGNMRYSTLSGNFTECYSFEYNVPLYINITASNSSVAYTINLKLMRIANQTSPINISSLVFPIKNI